MHILQQLIDVKLLQLKLETSMNIVAYTLNSIFQSEQINRQYKKLFALLEGGVKSLTSTNSKVPESSEVLLRLSLSGVHEHAPHVQLTIMGNRARQKPCASALGIAIAISLCIPNLKVWCRTPCERSWEPRYRRRA